MSAQVIGFPGVPVPWISSARLQFAVRQRLQFNPGETPRQAEMAIRRVLAEYEPPRAATGRA